MRITALVLLLSVAVLASSARAEEKAPEITTKTIEYKHGDVVLEGFLAEPNPRPAQPTAVLLVHAWRGHGDNVREKARMLAREGHVAFALDMYGKGVYAKDNNEARALATPFYKDMAMMRQRARAGLQILKSQPGVNPARTGAIGFCFGGTTVLELARDGVDIAGVVSFHGGLKTTKPAQKDTVKTRVLVCHGGDDPMVPEAQVLAFWKEMKDAGVDHQILILSDAVHAFTDPGAGNDPTTGVAYHKPSAERSFEAMRRFFKAAFK